MAKRTYDIQVRNAVARSGDPDLFPNLNIPRSTALQWIREGVKEVVTHPSLGKSCDVVIEENAAQQKACAAEQAKNALVRVSLRVTGFQMQYMRIAAGELKKKLLDSIELAKAHLSLKECLESIGLTAARYHSWVKRLIKCLLPDQSIVPEAFPNKNNKQGNVRHQRTRHCKRVCALQSQFARDVCETTAVSVCFGNCLVPNRA